MNKIVVMFFLFLIKFYQNKISKFTKPSCRFYPTCSSYSYQAIKNFGILKGFFLTIKRILRCNPLCKWGIDPIPKKKSIKKITKKYH